jgi:L-asparaginase
MQQKVVIFSTGGTILSSAASPRELTDYSGAGGKISDIFAVCAGNAGASAECRELFNVPSSRMDLKHWKILASELDRALSSDEISGAVVSHGTDSMEESAFLLNLVLKSEKPVVFTGAMRPASAVGADGYLNLLNAATVAASPASCGRGTLICMNGKIGEARLTAKCHTLESAAFQAPEYGFCGFVVNDRVEYLSRCEKPHTVHTEFDAKLFEGQEKLPFIPILTSYTEEDASLIEAALRNGARGIVYAGMGHGTITPAAESALKTASQQGIVVIRASRAPGPVLPSKKRWTEMGFIPAGTLNPVKARLLLALGIMKYGADRAEIERLFRTY